MPSAVPKANKGEWSEPYVAARILGEGKLYMADNNGEKNPNAWMDVLELMRDETANRLVVYSYDPQTTDVHISVNDSPTKIVPATTFMHLADKLMSEITSASGTTFHINEELWEQFWDSEFQSLKARSEDKSDLHLSVIDNRSGVVRHKIGFSIKSEFGRPSTLFNTAKASACVYKLEGFTEADADQVNSIFTQVTKNDKTRNKVAVGKRCLKIEELIQGKTQGKIIHQGTPYAPKAGCKAFSENLELLNPRLLELLPSLLWEHHCGRIPGRTIPEICDFLVQTNPLGLTRPQEKYTYMLKSFLYAAYCGMTASTLWDGRSEVNGGFIHVSKSGEVLAFYAMESDSFKDYLFRNCFLESPATSEAHGFYGSVYEENGDYYFRLNFQIRYSSTL